MPIEEPQNKEAEEVRPKPIEELPAAADAAVGATRSGIGRILAIAGVGAALFFGERGVEGYVEKRADDHGARRKMEARVHREAQLRQRFAPLFTRIHQLARKNAAGDRPYVRANEVIDLTPYHIHVTASGMTAAAETFAILEKVWGERKSALEQRDRDLRRQPHDGPSRREEFERLSSERSSYSDIEPETLVRLDDAVRDVRTGLFAKLASTGMTTKPIFDQLDFSNTVIPLHPDMPDAACAEINARIAWLERFVAAAQPADDAARADAGLGWIEWVRDEFLARTLATMGSSIGHEGVPRTLPEEDSTLETVERRGALLARMPGLRRFYFHAVRNAVKTDPPFALAALRAKNGPRRLAVLLDRLEPIGAADVSTHRLLKEIDRFLAEPKEEWNVEISARLERERAERIAGAGPLLARLGDVRPDLPKQLVLGSSSLLRTAEKLELLRHITGPEGSMEWAELLGKANALFAGMETEDEYGTSEWAYTRMLTQWYIVRGDLFDRSVRPPGRMDGRRLVELLRKDPDFVLAGMRGGAIPQVPVKDVKEMLRILHDIRDDGFTLTNMPPKNSGIYNEAEKLPGLRAFLDRTSGTDTEHLHLTLLDAFDLPRRIRIDTIARIQEFREGFVADYPEFADLYVRSLGNDLPTTVTLENADEIQAGIEGLGQIDSGTAKVYENTLRFDPHLERRLRGMRVDASNLRKVSAALALLVSAARDGAGDWEERKARLDRINALRATTRLDPGFAMPRVTDLQSLYRALETADALQSFAPEDSKPVLRSFWAGVPLNRIAAEIPLDDLSELESIRHNVNSFIDRTTGDRLVLTIGTRIVENLEVTKAGLPGAVRRMAAFDEMAGRVDQDVAALYRLIARFIGNKIANAVQHDPEIAGDTEEQEALMARLIQLGVAPDRPEGKWAKLWRSRTNPGYIATKAWNTVADAVSSDAGEVSAKLRATPERLKAGFIHHEVMEGDEVLADLVAGSPVDGARIAYRTKIGGGLTEDVIKSEYGGRLAAEACAAYTSAAQKPADFAVERGEIKNFFVSPREGMVVVTSDGRAAIHDKNALSARDLDPAGTTEPLAFDHSLRGFSELRRIVEERSLSIMQGHLLLHAGTIRLGAGASTVPDKRRLFVTLGDGRFGILDVREDVSLERAARIAAAAGAVSAVNLDTGYYDHANYYLSDGTRVELGYQDQDGTNNKFVFFSAR